MPTQSYHTIPPCPDVAKTTGVVLSSYVVGSGLDPTFWVHLPPPGSGGLLFKGEAVVPFFFSLFILVSVSPRNGKGWMYPSIQSLGSFLVLLYSVRRSKLFIA